MSGRKLYDHLKGYRGKGLLFLLKFRLPILSIAVVATMISPALSSDLIQTRFGIVETDFPHPETDYVHVINVRGKTVFRTEYDVIDLKNKFSLGKKDIVLFSTNCGGTACSDNLSFLVLEKGKPATVVTDKEFASKGGTARTSVRNRKILVDLGYDSNKRKTAVFDGKRLIFQYTVEETKSFPEEDCEWLYKYAMDGEDGSCIIAGRNDPRCTDPLDSFGLYAIRRLTAVSQNPAFDDEAFGRACIETCKSGKVPDYNTFRKAVCGH